MIELPENNMLFQEYTKYVRSNEKIEYSVKTIPINGDGLHKWVGGQMFNGYIYAIPNHESRILRYSVRFNIERNIGGLSEGTYKWTGGVIYQNKLYGFPRSANTLLVVDLESNKVSEVPLPFNYEGEHHYGGICTEDGVVYQPPRNTDHILCINLNNFSCKKIFLNNKQIMSRYCGSVVHPNGYAYFFPERNERVIKLNLHTKSFKFIGETLNTMCFDARIATDENIYGFSAYCAGILKIDVKNETCEMIREDITTSSYGTKLGVNGKLYSVPGDGRYVWEYDVIHDIARVVYDLCDERKAKYAGGVVTEEGDIYAIPADMNTILHYEPKMPSENVPQDIYRTLYKDYY